MLRHLIVPDYNHSNQKKHLSDCYAIARAIQSYRKECCVSMAYGMDFVAKDYDHIWHMLPEHPDYGLTDAEYHKVDQSELLWYKFGSLCQPVLPVGRGMSYQLLFTGSGEPGRLLDLVDSNKFTSASFGTGDDTKGMKSHRCHRPIGYDKLPMYMNRATAVLILDAGVSHALCEALFYGTLVLVDRFSDRGKSLGFDDWHYIATTQEIENRLEYIPLNQMQKQEETKRAIQQKLYQTKLDLEKRGI